MRPTTRRGRRTLANGLSKSPAGANVAFNPISLLTRATLVEMVRDPDVCALIRNIMIEVESLADKLSIELPVSIDQRIAGAEKVGEHKTSMLQDLETGRPMPHTRSVYACTKLLDVISRGGKK